LILDVDSEFDSDESDSPKKRNPFFRAAPYLAFYRLKKNDGVTEMKPRLNVPLEDVAQQVSKAIAAVVRAADILRARWAALRLAKKMGQEFQKKFERKPGGFFNYEKWLRDCGITEEFISQLVAECIRVITRAKLVSWGLADADDPQEGFETNLGSDLTISVRREGNGFTAGILFVSDDYEPALQRTADGGADICEPEEINVVIDEDVYVEVEEAYHAKS
jgi:hypothetical protein